MEITILFFATLKDATGEKRITLNLTASTVTLATLRAELQRRYPQAEAHLTMALASINEEFASDEQTVVDGDKVAFFPPVSGGQGDDDYPELYRLPYQAIDHDEIVSAITTPATGAVVFFSGLVRGVTDKDGHLPQTQHLEYEAYEAMALAKMRQVAKEIRERFPQVIGIAVVQRLGKLEVGQNTVLIACSSAHRDNGCFEACRYGIDRLKEIVPVWKKEVGVDNATWIEGDYRPNRHDRDTK